MKILQRRRAPGPPRVHYLVAPAGHPNYGDELIARVWLEHLARRHPQDTVVLDCHTPGQAAILLRGLHPDVVLTDTLWRVAADAAADAPEEPWTEAVRVAGSLGRRPRLDAGLDLLHGADTIHLLGGGYLNGLWPHHVGLVAAIAAVAQAYGIPAVATGQGLTPAPGAAAGRALADALAGFDLVDVRDEPSLAVAGPTGYRSVDDVWLGVGTSAVPIEPADDDTGEGPAVVLCLQSDLTDRFTLDGQTGPAALALLAERILDHWQITGDRVAVVEGVPGQDRIVTDLLGDRLAGARFVPFLHLWRHGLPAAARQTWISTRFHPHLVAAATGASGIAIPTDPGYYDIKHDSLRQAGSAWTILSDPEQMPDRPTAGGFAPDAVTAAVAAKQAVAARIYPDSSAPGS